MTTIPTFFVKDDTIIEVAYTEWEERPDGSWDFISGTKTTLPEDADRIVFELPIGCFEIRMHLYGGDGSTMTFVTSESGASVTACTQRAHFANEIEQTEPIVLHSTI